MRGDMIFPQIDKSPVIQGYLLARFVRTLINKTQEWVDDNSIAEKAADVNVRFRSQTGSSREGIIQLLTNDPDASRNDIPWSAPATLKISSVSPQDGAIGIPLETEIAITFSEPLLYIILLPSMQNSSPRPSLAISWTISSYQAMAAQPPFQSASLAKPFIALS